MKQCEDIKSITYLKTNSADLVNDVFDSKRAVIITQNGEAKVVVQDLVAYQQQQELILLLKAIAIGESEIKKSKVLKQEKVFSWIALKLKSQRSLR